MPIAIIKLVPNGNKHRNMSHKACEIYNVMSHRLTLLEYLAETLVTKIQTNKNTFFTCPERWFSGGQDTGHALQQLSHVSSRWWNINIAFDGNNIIRCSHIWVEWFTKGLGSFAQNKKKGLGSSFVAIFILHYI